jgi:hypothetical protein
MIWPKPQSAAEGGHGGDGAGPEGEEEDLVFSDWEAVNAGPGLWDLVPLPRSTIMPTRTPASLTENALRFERYRSPY